MCLKSNYDTKELLVKRMDSECAVCYSANANCKLVCKHAFCKDCIKEWYHKSDDPTCPMCRRAMYFKGMHKVVASWEQDRIDKRNEEVFGQAFDQIFEEDSDESYVTMESDSESEAGSDDSWETWDEELTEVDEPEVLPQIPSNTILQGTPGYYGYVGKYILEEIVELQKDYQRAMDMGMDFEEYLDYYVEPQTKRSLVEDDVFPHFKNLFVSNHKVSVRNKRVGKRVSTKTDTGFTAVFVVVF